MRYVLLIALASCVTDESAMQAKQRVQDECGSPPLAPGWTVANETINGMDRIVMLPGDYTMLMDWRDAVDAYEVCLAP